jgi:hypothetical protein
MGLTAHRCVVWCVCVSCVCRRVHRRRDCTPLSLSLSLLDRWCGGRQEKLSGSFHALVGADPVEVGRGAGFSRPGLGSGSGDVGSWSLAFWLYVLHDHTGHMRLLLLRGLDADQSRQVRVLLPSHPIPPPIPPPPNPHRGGSEESGWWPARCLTPSRHVGGGRGRR